MTKSLKFFSLKCMVLTIVVLFTVQVYIEVSEILHVKQSYDEVQVSERSIVTSNKRHKTPVYVIEKQNDEGRISTFEHCCVSNNWTLIPSLPRMSTDWKHWTYDKIIRCSKVNISNINQQTKFIHIQCMTNKCTYRDKVQMIEHGSACIDFYIEQCCKDKMTVPNIVHYIWYGLNEEFSFYGFLSFISVLRFVRPCVILVHGDHLPYGSYWKFISNIYPNIIHVTRLIKTDKIFGKYTHRLTHFSDIIRIEALLKYGGIYLDMDMVLVKEINFLRQYPCTMSRIRSDVLGSSFVMAERNASFLQKWLEGYKYHYNKDSYIYSAMQYPSLLAYNFSNLIHVELETLSRPMTLHAGNLYLNIAYKWSHLLGIHFYSRLYKEHVDKIRIRQLNSTFGAIARHILYGNKELCLD